MNNIPEVFPDLGHNITAMLIDILNGRVVGRTLCHTWYNEALVKKTIWSGKVEKVKRRSGNINLYRIAYWTEDETYEDIEVYDISKIALATLPMCALRLSHSGALRTQWVDMSRVTKTANYYY